ncbi:MAG: DUF4271 domain-containing protein [Flavobacteriaceae bacterium]|uniref:DUF4271 domain-containing protein n=1 Tax=Flavobacterium kayseriense TaxID=2764714 RepID=A0ABR7J3V4_9FLAO|nr:DUF4271 domain-containing protein [Flavobacterium kayseriense]MBC5840226.1 DUF4271 domain-containing protein [Flavobacterium kayseriense]MBC5847104.1 DUF4271 domain-containing protein [Flavobacterium kayseriense]MBX9888038.1 DUF4271 domain-containing protein [Flavobacteriaceae bacterium]
MIEHILHPRITENKDWATVLFVLSFAIIAITKSLYENRFGDFMNLIFSDKYSKVYRDSSQLLSSFTISLFIVQIISVAFFIQLSLSSFGYAAKTDWVLFIQIFTFLIFFVLSKLLIEKIIGTAFNIEEFVEQFNLQKVIYRTYISLFILPVNVILFYYDSISKNIPIVFISIILFISTLTYLVSIKNYQNLILSKLFYFILYLCTLEIAPYFFMYYLFTNRGT